MNVGILGSAFNPPSMGHADLINQALSKFDWVYLVPSFKHAFGKEMAGYHERCLLTQMFVKDLNFVSCSTLMVEDQVKTDGPVYTYDLLELIQNIMPENKLNFIIGPDNATNWHKFYRADEIKAKWGLFVGEEKTSIRSTQLRQLIAKNQGIDGLTTSSVIAQITKKTLYGKQL